MNLAAAVTATRSVVRNHAPDSVHDLWRKFRFRREIRLLEGKDLNHKTDRSVCFFTTIKCASTYVQKALVYLNRRCLDLSYANFGGYIHICSDLSMQDFLAEHHQRVFRPKGVLYGPLREFFPIEDIDQYRIVLMLRDPRDVVVSSYFSHAFSHPVPSNKERRKWFMDRREKVKSQTIDEYARGEFPEYILRVYSDYCEHLVRNQNVQVLRYEDFMQDFDRWFSHLEASLEMKLGEVHRDGLFKLKGGGAKPGENKFSHVRRATPGDHRDKLNPDSCEYLNQKFADVMETLGYEQE